MYETKYTIASRQKNEHVTIIDIQGGLTAAAETDLLETFSQVSDAGARVIILGFEGLTYMNSSGIGLLVRMVIRAQRQAQQVLAFGLQDHFRRIFELTRLQEVIRVYDSEADAMSALLIVEKSNE